MIQTVSATEIQAGDVILASSPRYHGPDVRVVSVEHISYPQFGREWFCFNVERMNGNATRLNGVPANKTYSVERAA